MRPSDEASSHLADRIIRQSLQRPENLRDFLQQVVPDLAGGFVYEHARLLGREFFLEGWRRREADLPFEVPYRSADGERLALVFVLIEHQSDTDPLMPLRLLYFVVGYWERQWRAWEESPRPRAPLRLAPVLPIVLYTGVVPWGSNRTIADLLGPPEAFHAFAPPVGADLLEPGRPDTPGPAQQRGRLAEAAGRDARRTRQHGRFPGRLPAGLAAPGGLARQ